MQRLFPGRALRSWPVALPLAIALVGLSTPARALGPNLLTNSSFEGGAYGYSGADAAPFSVIQDPSNAHTGSRALQVRMQARGSCQLKNPLLVWQGASYTTTVWYKGDGSLQLQILQNDRSAELAHLNLTAAAGWKKASITYKTGNVHWIQVAINDTEGKGTTVYLDDLYTGVTDGRTITFDGHHPDSHGFKLLWGDDFNDDRSIDVKDSRSSGFHWYRKSIEGGETPLSMFSVHDGLLTLTGCPVKNGITLNTIAPANNRDGFVGTVFRDTAPLYFEARFRMPDFEESPKSDYAFWAGMLEEDHVGIEMPGHPDHAEVIEDDFAELCSGWKPNDHGGGIVDWCWSDNGFNGVQNFQYPPVGTDYSQFHTYGCLLVPAAASNGWIGYRTNYFDGVPMVSACWQGHQEYHGTFPVSTESLGSYLFSKIDKTWGWLILGMGQEGGPMDIDYVRVYGVSPSSVRAEAAGPPAPPPTTQNLKAVARDRSVTLTWPSFAYIDV